MKSLPLYKQIQQDIRRMITIGKLREGDRIPSEKELADTYHVSQITSKNALIGLMEEGLLVRMQGKGTFVAKQQEHATFEVYKEEWNGLNARSGRIGLILPTMKTKVDQRFLNYIEKYASQYGFELMLRITRESQEEESKVISAFLQQGVDGIIIFPVENEMYNDSILRLSLDRFPLVLIDRFLKEVKTYSVSSDNINGTCEAVSGLLDKGHHSIAFISPEITNSVTDERAQGFEQAYLQRGQSIDKNIWCLLPLDTIVSGQAEDSILQFLRDNPHITAVFTANTELCGYTFRAACQLNKAIPNDLELITFDPPDLPGVSYIRQNEDEMCKVTLQLLLEQIEGKYEATRTIVPVTVIWNK